LHCEGFIGLHEAQVLIEPWRQFYHHQRPHRVLGY
jgi:transposase InsO family protein